MTPRPGNTHHTPTRHIGVLGLGIFVSRLLGFARDVLLAHLLGPASDAFLLAFRLPNLFRRMLSEGTFGLSFGAALARISSGETPRAAPLFARLAVRGTIMCGLAAALALALAAPPLVRLLGPGLPDGAQADAVAYLRLFLPYLPLSLACALAFTLASDKGNFYPQAWSSALFNTVLLLAGAAALAGTAPPESVPQLLCVAVVAAGLCQFWWGVRCLNIYAPRLPADATGGTAARKAARNGAGAFLRGLPAAVAGAAPHQLHLVAGMILASCIGSGGISGLYFAERLVELPIGLAGAALGMAALPALGRRADHRPEEFLRVLADSIRLSAFCSLPAAAGLLVLSLPLSTALFGHGAFNPESVALCAATLQGLCLALPAQCATRPLLSAAHALGKGKRALACACCGLAALVLVSGPGMFLAFRLDAPPEAAALCLGVGLAVGGWVNCGLLARMVYGAVRGACGDARPRLRPILARYTAAAAGMAALLWWIGAREYSAIGVLCLVPACAVIWIGGFALARNSDALTLLAILRLGRGERPDP